MTHNLYSGYEFQNSLSVARTDDSFQLFRKLPIDVFSLHLCHAACTETVVIVFTDIAALLAGQHYGTTLAAMDRAYPALKRCLAARAIFKFVSAHIWSDNNILIQTMRDGKLSTAVSSPCLLCRARALPYLKSAYRNLFQI